MNDLNAYFNDIPYPGRGMLLGISADGAHAVAAYFITGRSENSRNRVLVKTDHGIFTQPYDESKVEDPSLIFYSPVHICENMLILSNGTHTDTIYQALISGGTFHEALLNCTYEPDIHSTPRISGLWEYAGQQLSYQLSILYKVRNSLDCMRIFFDYKMLQCGVGHLLHTYNGCNSEPLPPFRGAPVEMALPLEDITTFTDNLWNSLPPDYRVALYTCYAPVHGGALVSELRNRHKIGN